ncbi:ketoacyl-synthetase C-terminal extension domain-containing protein, partial [Streptomyces sp. NRRL F-525]|uniref:ketoacyl-synthetase C-terminal extension domain-containing protein n=1 Tax=Streptomyces sp. NRRL F-525 TaxID=1463861 RepID=UPI00052401B7
SFGISGTNAHVVLEEAEPARVTEPLDPSVPTGESDAETDAVTQPVAWVLSARTPAALREQAGRLHTHLTDQPTTTA